MSETKVNRQNHTGNRHGHLTLLHKVASNGQGVGATWSAKCDCGRVVDVIAKYVVQGRIQTCGKCRYFRDLVARKTHKEVAYTDLITRTAKQGVQVDLSIEEYRHLLEDGCGLCGVHGGKSDMVPLRLDPTGALSKDNTVIVCKPCNKSLAGRTVPEFLAHIGKILEHLQLTK
jgi:hypothetical protein